MIFHFLDNIPSSIIFSSSACLVLRTVFAHPLQNQKHQGSQRAMAAVEPIQGAWSDAVDKSAA
jgi:hypothetical protein